MKRDKRIWLVILVVIAVLILSGCYSMVTNRSVRENIVNYSPGVFKELDEMRANDKSGNCLNGDAPLRPWEKQFCIRDKNSCYVNNGPTPPFPAYDIGGPGCVTPYSEKCQKEARMERDLPMSYHPCPPQYRKALNRWKVSERFDNKKGSKKEEKEEKEEFLDWSLYNPPVENGFTPNWWVNGGGYLPMGANYAYSGLAYQNALDRIYNPLRYPYRSQAFYEQGWYPNMNIPPQVIGCGGRRQGCIGGTESAVPTVPPPIEISERNIAPVNIMTRGPQGIPQQVGVLYKIFGSLNEVYPLYGRKKFPNSDQWDYYTLIGQDGNRVKAKVITRRKNEMLGTNDVVQIDGNTAKFRVTVYDRDMPLYVPYA